MSLAATVLLLQQMLILLNKAMGVIDDTEGFEYTAEEEEADLAEAAAAAEDMVEDSGSETSDCSSNIDSFSCLFCQKLFEEKEEVCVHQEQCEEANAE